jgi:HlyD family secretion protein
MKQIIRATLAVGCVLVGTTAIAACDKSEAGPTNGAPEVALAERRNLEINAEAVGLIEPIRIVDVKSKASGEVLRLMVETGDNVDRGALLAEIDPRDVRNGLAQAQADLDVAEARHRTSKAQRQRGVELRKANVITEQEYEAAELDEANANTQLVKARTNLELAQERMNDVRTTSPISGTVIPKTVEVGTIIASASQTVPGGTTLLQMADLSEMQVRTLVDETDMGKITAGMSARVTVSAYPNRNFMGTVLKIEPQAVVEQNVTMFPVLIQLDNRERLLRPGMNAEVAIEVARRDDVVTVPNAAVVGMRDAAAAGLVLGLSEETVRAALSAGMNGGRMGQNDAAAQKSQPDSAGGAAAGGAAGANAGDECAALLQKARTDRNSLTEAERNKLRECMPQGGMRRGGPGQGGAGQGGREGNGETRMGIIFVQTATGPAPRRVVLGVNDWDHTEVVQGLEPGEAVVLMSVARIQQQQQQMLDRMRQSQSGPFPAAGGRR